MADKKEGIKLLGSMMIGNLQTAKVEYDAGCEFVSSPRASLVMLSSRLGKPSAEVVRGIFANPESLRHNPHPFIVSLIDYDRKCVWLYRSFDFQEQLYCGMLGGVYLFGQITPCIFAPC